MIKYLSYILFIDKSKDVIIVLTPGKVGSSSVYKSLKNKFEKSHYIFHVHFISKNNIQFGIDFHRNSKRSSVPLHFIHSKILRNFFLNESTNLKIITLFREPISRYISDHFQNHDRSFLNRKEMDAKLMKRIIYEGLEKMEHIKYLENWINKELMEELDIEFYESINLKNKEYFIIKKANVQLLTIKLENLDVVFSEAIQELLGSHVDLINTNIGSSKDYSKMYKRIKNELLLDTDILQRTKTSKLYQSLYPNTLDK